jgi:hypothetical protein
MAVVRGAIVTSSFHFGDWELIVDTMNLHDGILVQGGKVPLDPFALQCSLKPLVSAKAEELPRYN